MGFQLLGFHCSPLQNPLPRGSTNTPIMELNHSRDGLLGPNSIMVVYLDPLGYRSLKGTLKEP